MTPMRRIYRLLSSIRGKDEGISISPICVRARFTLVALNYEQKDWISRLRVGTDFRQSIVWRVPFDETRSRKDTSGGILPYKRDMAPREKLARHGKLHANSTANLLHEGVLRFEIMDGFKIPRS